MEGLSRIACPAAITPYIRLAVQPGGMFSVLVVIASSEYVAVGHSAPPSNVFTPICNGFAPIQRVPRCHIFAESLSRILPRSGLIDFV